MIINRRVNNLLFYKYGWFVVTLAKGYLTTV